MIIYKGVVMSITTPFSGLCFKNEKYPTDWFYGQISNVNIPFRLALYIYHMLMEDLNHKLYHNILLR